MVQKDDLYWSLLRVLPLKLSLMLSLRGLHHLSKSKQVNPDNPALFFVFSSLSFVLRTMTQYFQESNSWHMAMGWAMGSSIHSVPRIPRELPACLPGN